MRLWAEELGCTVGPQPVLLLFRFPLRGTIKHEYGYFIVSWGLTDLTPLEQGELLHQLPGRGASSKPHCCLPGENTAARP